MKKHKASKTDFTFANLPHTRTEVFFDVIKMRFSTLLFLGLLALVFALPLIVADFIFGIVHLNVFGSLASGAITNEQAGLYKSELNVLCSAVKIPLYAVYSVGLSGSVRIIRQLVWGEPIFFRYDYKTGIKQNCLRYVVLALCFGVCNFVSVLCSEFLPVETIAFLPYGAMLFFVMPIILYSAAQSAVYTVKTIKSFKNGLSLYCKSPFKTLIFVAVPASFKLFDLMKASFGKYLIVSLLIVVITPLYVMAWLLVSFGVFDRYINAENYPDLYDKGIYRMDSKNPR